MAHIHSLSFSQVSELQWPAHTSLNTSPTLCVLDVYVALIVHAKYRQVEVLSTPGFLARRHRIDKQDARPMYLKVGRPNEIFIAGSIHIYQCIYWQHIKRLPVQSCDGVYVMDKGECAVLKLLQSYEDLSYLGSTLFGRWRAARCTASRNSRRRRGSRRRKRRILYRIGLS